MADAYLNIAERVLLAAGRPMRPREILRVAFANELLPRHLYGSRQDRTLQARLSEDIDRLSERSRFMRTAPGIFALRAKGTEKQAFPEYFARPRRKELNREWILAIKGRADLLHSSDDIVSIESLSDSLHRGNYVYLPYSELAADTDIFAIHSFLVVHRANEVLSFRAGRFFPSTDPLFGKRSVGLGGAVHSADADMLFESFFGVIANGIRELGSGIGLPRRLAERARYQNEVSPWVGVVRRKTDRHPNIVHIVLGYQCPTDFTPTKATLSVNDLRWVDSRPLQNDLNDYDATSRFLFESDTLRRFIQPAQTA